jgi:hypothetical protein
VQGLIEAIPHSERFGPMLEISALGNTLHGDEILDVSAVFGAVRHELEEQDIGGRAQIDLA